jgi:DsbC/DsbD-like thiol-disulfide interchange protein
MMHDVADLPGYCRNGGLRSRVMIIRILLAAGLLGLATPIASASMGDWVQSDNVRVRVLAEAPEADGTMRGAIEIALAPGWKTYWRDPGDAGVPPRFDFSGSTNAQAAAVEFPAPVRHDDGYAASNVYSDRVLLPLRLTVPEPDAPVRLDVTLDIGICQDICIPVNLRTQLDVPAAGDDTAAAPVIAEALAGLPGPSRPGEFELLGLKRVGGTEGRPEFEVAYMAGEPAEADLFIETPGDWFAAPPKATATSDGRPAFRFSVDRRSAAGEIAGSELRLTLTEGMAATERRFTLDASSSKP